MRLSAMVLMPALLIMTACASSSPPAAPASHPPSADLVCPIEPDIAAALALDPTGLEWDEAVREAGQACRDALARVCRWHAERGAEIICPAAVKP